MEDTLTPPGLGVVVKRKTVREIEEDDRLHFDVVQNYSRYLDWLIYEKGRFEQRYFESQPPQVVHRYKILGVLGKGNYGTVVQTQAIETGLMCATKIIPKARLKSKDIVAYAIHERKVLSAARHPFIPYLIDKQQDEDNLYLVTLWVPCGDLYRIMMGTHFKRFSDAEAKFFLSQVLLAIEYLHMMRVLYRDLKPENVMMGRDGYIFLVDYGSSKYLRCGGRTYSVIGTLEYMAPEVIDQKKLGYGTSVDWWAMGCLSYELIIGLPPFRNNPDNVYATIKQISQRRVKYPKGLSPIVMDFINQLCKKNPNERLGCHTTGSLGVQLHDYFRGMDFVKLLRKEVRPPMDPQSIAQPVTPAKFSRDDFFSRYRSPAHQNTSEFTDF